MSDAGGDWNEWKQLVLKLLEDNKNTMKSMDEKIQGLALDVALLKRETSARAAIWGMIPAGIAAIVWYLTK